MNIGPEDPNFDSNRTKLWGALYEDPSIYRVVGRDVCSAAIDGALLCCHGDAFSIYYIVGNSWYSNAAQCFIIRALPASLRMPVGRSHVSRGAKIIFFGSKSYVELLENCY
jgi:hypothetical protein